MSERTPRMLSSWFLERELIGDRIRLCVGLTLVGRQAGSATTSTALYIDSTYVSRKHAEISVDEDDKIVLKDLNSVNGTFVNGTKIQNEEIELKANDSIGVGVIDYTEPNLKHPIYKLIYAPLPKTATTTTTCKDRQQPEHGQQSKKSEKCTNFEKETNPKALKTAPCVPIVGGGSLGDTASGSKGAALKLRADMTTSLVSKQQPKPKKDETPSDTTKSNDQSDLKIEPPTNAAQTTNDTTNAEVPKVATPAAKLPVLYHGDIVVLSDDEDDVIHIPIKLEPQNSPNKKVDSKVVENAEALPDTNTVNVQAQSNTPNENVLSDDEDDVIHIPIKLEPQSSSNENVDAKVVENAEARPDTNTVNAQAQSNTPNENVLSDDEDDVIHIPIKLEPQNSSNQNVDAKVVENAEARPDTNTVNAQAQSNTRNEKVVENAEAPSDPNTLNAQAQSTTTALTTATTTIPCSQKPSTAQKDSIEDTAVIHEPILPELKREFVRSCTNNVVEIFGGADDLILESVKDINPLLYNSLNSKRPENPLLHGDAVDLLSDNECDDPNNMEQNVESFGQLVPAEEGGCSGVKETNTAKTTSNDANESSINNVEHNRKDSTKSPNLFDASLNNADDSNVAEENSRNSNKKAENSVEHPAQVVTTEDPAQVAEELAEYMDDDDDIMFSQILMNDIKSEMMAGMHVEFDDKDDANDDVNSDNEQQEHSPFKIQIKQEPRDNALQRGVASSMQTKQHQKNVEIQEDIWIITDDEEDYDEELEHKVSDWSTKLLSQQMNMSQVFDINDKDKNAQYEASDYEDDEPFGLCESEDLDAFFNEALVDDVIATLAQKTGETKGDTNLELEVPKVSTENSSSSSSDSCEPAKSIGHTKREATALPKVSNKKIALEQSTSKEATRKEATSKEATSKERTDSTQAKGIASDKKFDANHVATKPPESKKPLTSKEREKSHKKDTFKPVKRLQHGPSVIDAPSLPRHKGKHRGVSAETCNSPSSSATDTRKKSSAISAQLKEERYREELKKKWFAKPAEERSREKEKKRKIKETRKERLKELADKQSAETTPSKETLKRKHDEQERVESGEKKKAKVKVTAMNRGAMLAEDIGATKKSTNAYKIPKTKPSTSSASGSMQKSDKETTNTTQANTSKATNSTTTVDAFALEMTKVDKILCRRYSNNNNNSNSNNNTNNTHAKNTLSRSSSLDGAAAGNGNKSSTPTETAKAVNAPTRKTNKISFASMQRNFMESRKNQELLETLTSNRSCLIDVKLRNANNERQKKCVRFNDTPIVYYIERINGANKRVDRKDILPSPTCADRAQMIRLSYAMVDKTAQIISQILTWSNEWLLNRNAQVDAASDILLPMPTQFSSFNHYKSIVVPLMKLEFISVLEREKSRCKTKAFNVQVDQVSPHLDRYLIVARYSSAKHSDTKCELVVLEWGRYTTFAYMSSKRIGISNTTIVYEVLAKDLPLDDLRANLGNPINVRPMVDIVRVEFGAVNAIYQLEQSPLLKQILDPMELFKLEAYPKSNIQYYGFDDLNERQKDVLMQIYKRAIQPTPNIALIQGPPGTGKSCVIANLVHQLLYGNEVRILDQKVLICAQSNAAVDAIAEKLFFMSQKKVPDNMFRLIRFGLLERINPRVQHATLPKIIERNQIRKLKSTCAHLQLDQATDVKEYLRNEIIKLEAEIEHTKIMNNNIKGTVQEEQLLEKVRQIQLMRNIVDGVLRPEDERSLYKWHLAHANVVCTTLSSCVKLSQYVNYFDICIIDEATQCTEPWTLMPLKFGIKTLVLVGDTQQLPATVLSKKASDFGLGTSLFTRIQRCIESVNLKSLASKSNAASENSACATNKTDILFGLKTQYRMHPEICKWPNSYFYKNDLIDDPKTHHLKTPLKPFSVLNLTYTQDNNCLRGQIVNELEAKFVARLVKTLDCYIPMKYNSYGVITPYAQQRGALEKALSASGFPKVTVNTIDSYQGTERDVIIISNARTNGIGFLANYQRLNVAVTRPKKCLILCGNFKNLESVPAWHSLLVSARERKLYHELSANCMDDMHRNVIPKIKVSKTAEQPAATTTLKATATTTTTKEQTTKNQIANQTNQSNQ